MNSKTYKIGFFVLIVINVALVVILALGPKPPMQMGIKEEISQKLGFTDEQKSQFDVLALAHRDQMQVIEVKEQEIIKAYFDHLSDTGQADTRGALMKQMNILQEKKMEVTFTHFQDLKSLCTEDQLRNFDGLMNKMVQVLVGQGPSAPPPL